jgi:hypothetical protein
VLRGKSRSLNCRWCYGLCENLTGKPVRLLPAGGYAKRKAPTVFVFQAHPAHLYPILPLYGFEMKELQQGMFLTALSGLVSYDLKGGIAPIGPPVSGCPRTLRPQRKDSMQMSGIIDHLNL